MRDDLSGLTVLVTVADKRSFTAAAAALRVTPSAVSQAIKTLEERVGVRLVQRTTRSVGLTEAGARFVARLEPALQGVQDAFESLGELRDRPAGLLRLSVPREAYESVVAPKLPPFLATYPDIRVDIAIDDAFIDIVARGFDAGLRMGEMVAREMISVPVSPPMRVAVVGSPAYFAEHPRPRHPRDLPAHDCINYRRRSQGDIYRWEFDVDGKEIEIAVDGRVLIDDGHMMVEAAVAGLGLAYVPESFVREHLAARRLVRVLDRYCLPFPGYFLYYPSRRHIAPKLAALVEALRFRRRAGAPALR